MHRMLTDKEIAIRQRTLSDTKERKRVRSIDGSLRPDVPRMTWLAITFLDTPGNPAYTPLVVGPCLGLVEGDNWMWGGGPSYRPLPPDLTVVATYPNDPDDWEGAWVTHCKTFPAEPGTPAAEYAWIAPDGRWFQVPHGEHQRVGDALYCQETGKYGAWQDLIGIGWISISLNGLVLGNSERGTSDALSDPQMAIVEALLEREDTPAKWKRNLVSALNRADEYRSLSHSIPQYPNLSQGHNE